MGSVGKPVGGESRSWETFNGCILLPRQARLLNKQLIESKLLRADRGGAGFTCECTQPSSRVHEDDDVAGGDNKVRVYKALTQSCD